MLRIAVQSKGRLYEDTISLFQEAGIKISSSKRTLLVQSPNFPIEILFLRDDDIPQTVANGVADLGVVGENEFLERDEDALIIKRLGFSKCRLSLAIPKAEIYNGIEWFNGKKIATSYPGILSKFMKDKGVDVDMHVITGSVEIAPGATTFTVIFDGASSLAKALLIPIIAALDVEYATSSDAPTIPHIDEIFIIHPFLLCIIL